TPEEIEFLQADESTVDLPLASLDTVIIIHTHRGAPASSPGFCKIYRSILNSRPNLKRFCVEGADVNPLLVFQEPGQESRHAQWVCADLEHLSLTLSWPASSNKTAEEMRRRWDAVFIQIDKLEHLKSLSIESEDLGEYPGHGFLQYCHHLSHLESLVLAAPGPTHAWREPQIDSLLARCPRLRTLDLGCLKDANGEAIKEWLKKNHREYVDLTFNEEDFDDGNCSEYGDDDGKKNEGYSEYDYGVYEDDVYEEYEEEEDVY
ncbi:hypothetical protein BGX20_010969, partial [Mortierella sp. AD010]